MVVVDPGDEVLDGAHFVFGHLRHVYRVEEVHHVVHLSGGEEVQQDPSLLHASPQYREQRRYRLPLLQ